MESREVVCGHGMHCPDVMRRCQNYGVHESSGMDNADKNLGIYV